jgi:hypothetical protein
MLTGAMQALVIGDPLDIASDMGPVINDAAREQLQAHLDGITRNGRLLYARPLPQGYGSAVTLRRLWWRSTGLGCCNKRSLALSCIWSDTPQMSWSRSPLRSDRPVMV